MTFFRAASFVAPVMLASVLAVGCSGGSTTKSGDQAATAAPNPPPGDSSADGGKNSSGDGTSNDPNGKNGSGDQGGGGGGDAGTSEGGSAPSGGDGGTTASDAGTTASDSDGGGGTAPVSCPNGGIVETESNDSVADANLVGDGSGGTVCGVIDPPTESDFYKFTLKSTATSLSFHASGNVSIAITADGQSVTFSPQGNSGQPPFAAGKEYTLEVRSADGQKQEYNLTVTQQ